MSDDVIIPQPLSPDERFETAGTTDLDSASVVDFWQWACSDLIGNTERGALAEYLVAKAIGAVGETRNAWNAFDLKTDNGVRVEVKSAAYAQAWYQKEPSKIQFSIGNTRGWFPKDNEFGEIPERHSDVYVFCLLAEKDKRKLNPLNLAQWEFYVIPTPEIDQDFGDRKSISLQQVRARSSRYRVAQLKQVTQASGVAQG